MALAAPIAARVTRRLMSPARRMGMQLSWCAAGKLQTYLAFCSMTGLWDRAGVSPVHYTARPLAGHPTRVTGRGELRQAPRKHLVTPVELGRSMVSLRALTSGWLRRGLMVVELGRVRAGEGYAAALCAHGETAHWRNSPYRMRTVKRDSL
jgi:hypothetical protein